MIDRLGLLTGMAMLRSLWSVEGSFLQTREFALLLMKTEDPPEARGSPWINLLKLARRESTVAGGWRLKSGDLVDHSVDLCVLACLCRHPDFL